MSERKKLAVALQAGAAIGAFEWGVLTRLSETFEITGVSGASAGSINAAAFASGHDKGGDEGARKKLREVWEAQMYDKTLERIPVIGPLAGSMNRIFNTLVVNPAHKMDPYGVVRTMQTSVHSSVLAFMSHFLKNLDELVDSEIDFPSMRKNKDGIDVFVNATDILTNESRVFSREEISAKAVMASCAVPGLIGAVEIDGREYWDGALSDNPAIMPLLDSDGTDVMVVQTFPYAVHEKNEDVGMGKVMHMLMNNSMRKDILHIQDMNERARKDPAAAKKLGIKETHTHLINSHTHYPNLVQANHSFNMSRGHIMELYEAGYDSADKWIAQNFDNVGQNSTFTADSAKDAALKAAKEAPKKKRSKKKVRKPKR